jgi:hypothetical protein
MKANELRIGNYVYDTLGKVNKIDLEAITYIVKEPHNQVKPIPLTEEWLEKFGFKAWDDKKTIYTLERHIDKYNNTCFRFWLQLDKLVFDYIQNEIHPTESIFDDKNIIRLEVKYVNQLQNLYFALTGEELIIKSE